MNLSFSGIMVDGQTYELSLWNKRIKGATPWPTPTQRDGISGAGTSPKREGGLNLRTAVQMWPTPNARNWKGAPGAGSIERGGRHSSLPAAVKRETFPTPIQRDWKSGTGMKERNHTPNLSTYIGGQLNPDWVEWLMGFPGGWTK